MENLPAGFGLICGGFFLLVTLAAGVLLVLLAMRNKKKAESSQTWPSTQGKVTVSEIRESSTSNDDGSMSTYYHPSVAYEYEVLGKTFTCNKISFGGTAGYGNQLQVRPILERYPVGAAVTVFYDPGNPSEAVLERKAGGFRYLMIGGILLLAVGLCIGCVMGAGLIRNF